MANVFGCYATGAILFGEIADTTLRIEGRAIRESTVRTHLDHIRIKFELLSMNQIPACVLRQFSEQQRTT